MLDPGDPLRFVGTVIDGRYRVVSFLGHGSMSRVYEVEGVGSARRGAMKVMLAELGKDPEIAARLVREGKAIGMFAHPNIVELVDAGVLEDRRPFVVTELIRGVSLRALIDAAQLDPLRALAIIRQVLEALEHAHRHGVIHRDIKPENIMVADSGRPDRGNDLVKVLDFGVAKLVGDTGALLDEATLTRTGYDVFGSPLYIAPESVLGRLIDPRTDIYSVGCMLFEMLAGRPPFDDPDPMVLLRLQASAKAPTLAERAPKRAFTPELEYLVSEALAKQPEQRFASATDMIAIVDAARASIESPRSDTLIGSSAAKAMRMPPLASSTAPTRFDGGTAPRARAARSVPARLTGWARSSAAAFKCSSPRRRIAIVAGGLAAIVLIAIVVSLSGGSSNHELASAASKSIASPTPQDDADPLVEQGHAYFARGRHLDALSAYERAIARSPKLGGDSQIRTNATVIATGKDAVSAVVALELLGTRLTPPARDEIAAQASRGKARDVRHRAFAIAERDGFVDSVDRFESHVLDLKDAKTCDDRRAAIEKLRALSDRRAIGELRRARDRFPCVTREATDALAHLEANP